eukprot:353133-Chlamydomonas_euryale.AAC.6
MVSNDARRSRELDWRAGRDVTSCAAVPLCVCSSPVSAHVAATTLRVDNAGGRMGREQKQSGGM